MAATAIAASFLVIAQSKVNRESRELSDTQDQLMKLKDKRLAEDLRGKDLVIAEVNKAASEANLKAGKLELDAVIQRKLTAEANERAAEAQLALEKIKTPRALNPAHVASFIVAMSEFKYQRVFFGVTSDSFEAIAFANQIYTALKEAGVNVEDRLPFVSRAVGTVRGVVASYTTGNDKATRFASAFIKALHERGVVAGAVDGLDEETAQKIEKQHGFSRNHDSFEHVAVAVGEKP